jgi:hypothetical protein
MKGLAADFTHMWQIILNDTVGLNTLSPETIIERQMAEAQQALAAAQQIVTTGRGPFGPMGMEAVGSAEQIADQVREVARLQGQLHALALMQRDLAPPEGGLGGRPSAGAGLLPTEEEIRKADQARERLRGYIDDLKFQQEQLGRTSAEQAIYNAVRAAGTTVDTAAGQQIKELVIDINARRFAQEQVIEAERRQQAMMEQGRQLTQSLETPLETYMRQLEELNRLLAADQLRGGREGRPGRLRAARDERGREHLQRAEQRLLQPGRPDRSVRHDR